MPSATGVFMRSWMTLTSSRTPDAKDFRGAFLPHMADIFTTHAELLDTVLVVVAADSNFLA